MEIYCRVVIFFACVTATQGILSGHISADELFKKGIPLMDINKLPNVTVDFSLVGILKLDPPTETFSLAGTFTLSWYSNVTWNLTEAGGKHTAIFSAKDVWTPNIGILNGMKLQIDPAWRRDFYLTIGYRGWTVWRFGGRFDTICNFDLYVFPWDTHKCDIVLGGVSYDEFKLYFVDAALHEDSPYHNKALEWTVYDHAGIRREVNRPYEGTDYIYPTLIFRYYVKRNPIYYKVVIIFPTFFLGFLCSLIHLIPLETPGHLAFNFTVVLAYFMFIFLVAGKLPHAGKSIPIILVYMFSMMFMAIASIIANILIQWVRFWNPKRPMPRIMEMIIFQWLPMILCDPDGRESVSAARMNVNNIDEEDEKSDDEKSPVRVSPAKDEEAFKKRQFRGAKNLKMFFFRFFLFLEFFIPFVCYLACVPHFP